MPDQQSAISRRLMLALLGLCLLVLVGSTAVLPAQATPVPPNFTPSQWVYLPSVSRDYDPSWQWQTPSPALSPVPPVATNALPVAALDRQGLMHLLWAINASRSEGKFIFHSVLTTSGWTTPTAILPTLGTSYSPSTPVVGPDGSLHLLWLNKLTSNANPRLLYSSYRDGAWSAEEAVYDYPVSSVGPGVVQIARDGQAYALYYYNGLYRYTFQAKRTGTGWTNQAVPETSPGSLYYFDWLIGDHEGAVLRFISRLGTNSQLLGLYSYWMDGTYQITDAPLPFVPHNTYAELDGSDNLHAYWRAEVPVPGGQVMGLYHQCFDPAMVPASEPELLTGQQATTATLLPAADEAGRWTLAWQMVATGEAKIGVWEGCQIQKIVSVPAEQTTPWPPFQALFSRVPNRWCGLWTASGTGYRARSAEIAEP